MSTDNTKDIAGQSAKCLVDLLLILMMIQIAGIVTVPSKRLAPRSARWIGKKRTKLQKIQKKL